MTARGRRINATKIAPTVMRLTRAGVSRKDIARQMGCSIVTVSRIRREHAAGSGNLIVEVRQPVKKADLSQEAAATVDEMTADCFERFYNRYNTEYTLPEHCKRFVEMALGEQQIVLNVPPGHAKSSTFSVWLPLWLVTMNRDVQILLVSKTFALAKEFLRSIAWEFENNERLKAEHGIFKPQAEGGAWSAALGMLEVEGRNRTKAHGGTIRGLGAGQQVLGFRGDIIIVDDLADIDTSKTEVKRVEIADWFNVELRSRMRPGGIMWVIGTRFHPEDIYGELVSQTVTGDDDSLPLYRHINFPALADPDTGGPTNDFDSGVALWPQEWPADKLKTKVYNAIGAARWQQMYQQVPLTGDDALARPEWIYGDADSGTEDRRGCLDLTRNVGVGARGAVRVISVDPSPTKYVGAVVADVVPLANGHHEIVVMEVVRAKMMQRDLMAMLDRMVAEHAPVRYVVFEINSFARWFTQDVDFHQWSKLHSIRVIGHTTHRNKTDPENGLESMSREFEFGRIRLPYADVFAKEQSQLLIREATQYTAAYKGTTDVLMALWFLHFNRRKLKGPNQATEAVKSWFAPKRLVSGFGKVKA